MLDPDERVSDADRQAVVDRLSTAVADGHISLDEFADHAGRAYAAKTRAELAELTRDLHLPVLATHPGGPAAAPATTDVTEAKPKRRWIVAIMGGEDRRGRWKVSRRTTAVAIMGGIDLDLRDALVEDDVVEISAWALMGGVTVVVPEGIPVEFSGFMLMGGRSNRVKDVPTLPGAPLVRIRGFGMWGGIDVRSKPKRLPGDEHAPRPSRSSSRHGHRRDRYDRHDNLPAPPADPEAPPGLLPQAGLVTMVCTDLVGSTRLSDQLGDQRWREVLFQHNALVRGELARHGGTEVKTSGDGFLLTFPSARRAVTFATDVQGALAEWRRLHPDTPLELRVGVHAGEVERDGEDLVGRNVSLTCRLCDAAAPGEVLVSSVVADLADSSSDLSFGEVRSLALAGIDRPVTARPAGRR